MSIQLASYSLLKDSLSQYITVDTVSESARPDSDLALLGRSIKLPSPPPRGAAVGSPPGEPFRASVRSTAGHAAAAWGAKSTQCLRL